VDPSAKSIHDILIVPEQGGILGTNVSNGGDVICIYPNHGTAYLQGRACLNGAAIA
jgi:hypothetical protein